MPCISPSITGKEPLKVGELPEPAQLQGVGQVPVNETALSTQIDEQLMVVLKGTSSKEDHPGKEVKPLHYLAPLGQPTISQHTAQRIWNLEFVEMEEFL